MSDEINTVFVDHGPPQGISLRDYFAGQALAGIAAAGASGPYKDDAEMAYRYADAMIDFKVSRVVFYGPFENGEGDFV